MKIELTEKAEFIVPEYKIELLNKSKKIINKFEHISQIKNSSFQNEKILRTPKNDKKNPKVLMRKIKDKEEIKRDKKPRTLWVRKKKAS